MSRFYFLSIKTGLKLRNFVTKTHMVPVKAALIDLSGTLHVDDQPTDGAVDALKRYIPYIH